MLIRTDAIANDFIGDSQILRSNCKRRKMSGFNNNTEAIAKKEIVATIFDKGPGLFEENNAHWRSGANSRSA
ncbi:MAG: hypothetical protein ACR65T_05875 [Methylocystis sp.]|uniref:hypothetical protein n=1 Tax=Methylocystis sp. TaxID=1911079 RepID=UPI003DA3C5EE